MTLNYCGLLNLDKPIGLTSRDVVNRVARLVRPAKAGHAGTLDPLATGVLVVCVGHATRLIAFAQQGQKRYLARFRLGQFSDTDDITGTITSGGDVSHIDRAHIDALVPEFIGTVSQVPPQFSAIHVRGQRAYDLARRGETVDLAARTVTIHSIIVTDFQSPEFELEIVCGSGTYVRSIGRDLGHRLGCGAIMTHLRRQAVGPFDAIDAIGPDELTSDNIKRLLQPAIRVVSHFPQRQLTPDEIIAIRRGQSILGGGGWRVTSGGSVQHADTSTEPVGARVALLGVDGLLLGIGEIDVSNDRIRPRIVFPGESSS